MMLASISGCRDIFSLVNYMNEEKVTANSATCLDMLGSAMHFKFIVIQLH